MIRAAALALALAAARVPAAAQDTAGVAAPGGDTAAAAVREGPAARPVASPALPREHWAVQAAWQAYELGLVQEWLPAQRSVPRAVVARALREAADWAQAERPALAALAGGWYARFVEEFPEYRDGAPHGVAALGGWAGAGAHGGDDRLAPFRTVPADVPEGSARVFDTIPGRLRAEARASLGAALGEHLAWMAEPRVGSGGVAVPRWEVVAGAGAWALSVGEQPVAYGPGWGGGVVLSGLRAMPRVELQTAVPLRPGGVLRLLGPTTLHTSVGRMDRDRHPAGPWFWSARVGFQPHPRLSFGINRASVFGGSDQPVTVRRLAGMLVGVLSSGSFENQVLSFDVRYRLPGEPAFPVTAYLEWGADDGAGALDEEPGIAGGVYVAAVPGARGLALGAEGAYFGDTCCGHGSWYAYVPGNWAYRDQPLGHPLGGGGWQAMLYGQLHLLDSALRLRGEALVRRRTDPSNLFVPAHAGRSAAGNLELEWRVRGRAEVHARLFREAGDGWHEQRYEAEVRYLFQPARAPAGRAANRTRTLEAQR